MSKKMYEIKQRKAYDDKIVETFKSNHKVWSSWYPYLLLLQMPLCTFPVYTDSQQEQVCVSVDGMGCWREDYLGFLNSKRYAEQQELL